MSGARALVAAVPQRVWTAVAGLVALASVGVALVLGAGLSTWQGGVTHAPFQGSARPPGSVLSPPGSAVIVVPTPRGHVPRAPAAAPGGANVPPAARSATATVGAPATVPTALPAPVPAPVPAAVATTARPRTAASTVALPHTAPGGAVGSSKHLAADKQADHRRHGNHGKHLGWTKGVRAGSAHGHGRAHKH